MSTSRQIVVIIVAVIYILLGLLSLKYALLMPSYMQRLKAKGINPARRLPRIYLLMLAALLIYSGVKAISLVF
jgi:hypothetical protein